MTCRKSHAYRNVFRKPGCDNGCRIHPKRYGIVMHIGHPPLSLRPAFPVFPHCKELPSSCQYDTGIHPHLPTTGSFLKHPSPILCRAYCTGWTGFLRLLPPLPNHPCSSNEQVFGIQEVSQQTIQQCFYRCCRMGCETDRHGGM